MARPYKLTPPVVLEHPIQVQICKVLRLEIGPPGHTSVDWVTWWAVDHANYAGQVPGVRIERGIIAGIPDLFFLHRSRAAMIEIKTTEGEMSTPQQAVGAAILAAGGLYAVVRNAEETLICLDDWRIPRRRRVNF